MNALSVALEVPLMIIAPLVCRFKGHRWFHLGLFASPGARVCVRCGVSNKP